jgi:hypothetical protein
MTFAAFQARHDGTDFSFEGRDESAGVLGVFHPREAAPLLTANTLEELEREARAHLGKEPSAYLYLTDDGHRVYRIMINEEHHATIEKRMRRTAIACVLLVFGITCLVGAYFGSLGIMPLLVFVGIAALYVLLLRVDFFNEIEGAVICEIMLILALLLVHAVQRARNIAPKKGTTVACRYTMERAKERTA